MSQACKPWAGRLTAWFDGETNEALSSETREHLLDCGRCRSALAAWRGLRDDLEVLQPSPATPEILQGIGAGLSDGLAREVRSLDQALRWWKVAASVLVLAGGFALLSGNRLPVGSASASAPLEIDKAFEELLDRPASSERRP